MKELIINLLGGYSPRQVEEVAIGIAQQFEYKVPQVKGFLSHVTSDKYNL